MTQAEIVTRVAVIGGGIVGVSVAQALAHRGVDTVLVESHPGLAFAASGTNSGILHTGFDSTPGELETELILRSAGLRPALLNALGVPVRSWGAVLIPQNDGDLATIADLTVNACRNGVDVEVRARDGALVVPGESVTDPVAFTLALASSAVAAGARIETDARVVDIDGIPQGLRLVLADGRRIDADVVINAAGLYADELARRIGDDSFEIYPRKGEFFVFELEPGTVLERILLPVPTKRTKGVLVFPTLDGRVVAGPTAHDQSDKEDWSVRDEAYSEILPKAYAQYPELRGRKPVASYAGLRPAGRGSNYVIGQSAVEPRLINVAAIRSTGLSASLGIADYVVEMLPAWGVETGAARATVVGDTPSVPAGFWWQRSALRTGRSQ